MSDGDLIEHFFCLPPFFTRANSHDDFYTSVLELVNDCGCYKTPSEDSEERLTGWREREMAYHAAEMAEQ